MVYSPMAVIRKSRIFEDDGEDFGWDVFNPEACVWALVRTHGKIQMLRAQRVEFRSISLPECGVATCEAKYPVCKRDV